MDILLLASGNGIRMKTKIPKQFIKINNISILEIAIIRILKSKFVKNILVVILPEYLEKYMYLKNKYKLLDIICGSSTRYLSIINGLNYFKKFGHTDNILISESVRPFYNLNILEKLYTNIKTHCCITPISKTTNTNIQMDGDKLTIINRHNMYDMNTPILYNFDLLYEKVQNSLNNNNNDITQMVELFDTNTTQIIIEEPIPKLTFNTDLILFQTLFDKYSNEIINKSDIIVNVEESIKLLKQKQPVIIYDKFNEQEGDLTFPAEIIDTPTLNTMLNDCKGVVCQTITKDVFDRLNLKLITKSNFNNTCPNFLPPIDSINIISGISSDDRILTIKSVIDENTTGKDFIIPGHQNILKCADNLSLSRQGHTEISTVLVELAGYKPSAVICEIMDKQNVPMREDDLINFCYKHTFKIVYLHEIYNYYVKKLFDTITLTPNIEIKPNMDINLFENKIVVLTGGSKGIGNSLKEILTYNKAIVYDLSRTTNCDVSDYNQVKQYIDNLNIDKIDILINNAGYCSINSFNNTSVEEWNKHVNINLNGVFNVTKCCLSLLNKSESPVIFNITSTAAVTPKKDWSAYCVTKTAISTLSTILQNENKNLKIYEICPGRTNTVMRNKLFKNEDSKTLLSPGSVAFFITYVYNNRQEDHKFIIRSKSLQIL
tara:strand:+ start:213 stop:2195 length:1983 start_codon:yes stop_codon:yes gene_type:complete